MTYCQTVLEHRLIVVRVIVKGLGFCHVDVVMSFLNVVPQHGDVVISVIPGLFVHLTDSMRHLMDSCRQLQTHNITLLVMHRL